MKRREVEMLWKPGKIELLAPARDLRSARAAIDCGADAVTWADRVSARGSGRQ